MGKLKLREQIVQCSLDLNLSSGISLSFGYIITTEIHGVYIIILLDKNLKRGQAATRNKTF